MEPRGHGVRQGISPAWSMSPSATSDSQRRTTRPHRKPKRSGKHGEDHGKIMGPQSIAISCDRKVADFYDFLWFMIDITIDN